MSVYYPLNVPQSPTPTHANVYASLHHPPPSLYLYIYIISIYLHESTYYCAESLSLSSTQASGGEAPLCHALNSENIKRPQCGRRSEFNQSGVRIARRRSQSSFRKKRDAVHMLISTRQRGMKRSVLTSSSAQANAQEDYGEMEGLADGCCTLTNEPGIYICVSHPGQPHNTRLSYSLPALAPYPNKRLGIPQKRLHSFTILFLFCFLKY